MEWTPDPFYSIPDQHHDDTRSAGAVFAHVREGHEPRPLWSAKMRSRRPYRVECDSGLWCSQTSSTTAQRGKKAPSCRTRPVPDTLRPKTSNLNTYAPLPPHLPENHRHRSRVRALRPSRIPGPSTINANNN